MQPNDAINPQKQEGIVYKIPCECGKVYIIGEMGRCMYEQIKGQCRDIWLLQTKLQPFLNIPKSLGIICSGMRLSL